MKSLLVSILLLFCNTCFGYDFTVCSVRQQDKILIAIDKANIYVNSVIQEKNSRLFVKWFGFNEINDIKETFTKIHAVLQSKDIHFMCGCPEEIYSFAVTGTDYRMVMCNKFFKAPLNGFDSQAGTIIHELSHFDTIAGTHDFFTEKNDCLKMASLKGGQEPVLQNAGNYEYLAEDLYISKRDDYLRDHRHRNLRHRPSHANP